MIETKAIPASWVDRRQNSTEMHSYMSWCLAWWLQSWLYSPVGKWGYSSPPSRWLDAGTEQKGHDAWRRVLTHIVNGGGHVTLNKRGFLSKLWSGVAFKKRTCFYSFKASHCPFMLFFFFFITFAKMIPGHQFMRLELFLWQVRMKAQLGRWFNEKCNQNWWNKGWHILASIPGSNFKSTGSYISHHATS